MRFAQASPRDALEILALYRACAALPSCRWNAWYPNRDTLRADLRFGGLYTLRRRGRLIACASLILPEEEERGAGWRACRRPCALARIGTQPALQGRGYGRVLLQMLLLAARCRGYDGMRLLVSPQNPAALRLYAGAGFRACGTKTCWGHTWLCMERKL